MVEVKERTVRPFEKSDLPHLIARFSEAPLLSQVAQAIVAIETSEGILTLTFSTPFCQGKAQDEEKRFKEAIEEISGFKGPIRFTVKADRAPLGSSEAGANGDQLLSNIATLFRGEIITR